MLIRTLREAAGGVEKQERTVVGSVRQVVEGCETVRGFTGARRAGLGECFFWEQPAEQNTLVGVGAGTTIETNGSTCFIDAASAWRALLQDAVVTYAPAAVPTPGSGPVLFGGFAFDPLSPPTPLWAGFPGGLLILPRFLLSYSANYVTLTINRMVRASDTIEQSAQEIEADVRHLQAAIEHAPTIPREETASQHSIHEIRPASEWMEMVADIVDMIQHGAFEKVVLARDMQVKLDDPKAACVIGIILQSLRESYPAAYVFAVQRGERFFMGATPERLIHSPDGRIPPMAITGRARPRRN